MKEIEEKDGMDDDETFPKVTKAFITGDGGLRIKFNKFVSKSKKEVVFMADALFALALEYGEMNTDGSDYNGILHVYEDSIFEDEDEDDEEEEDDDVESNVEGDVKGDVESGGVFPGFEEPSEGTSPVNTEEEGKKDVENGPESGDGDVEKG